jgi:hypothetical protein
MAECPFTVIIISSDRKGHRRTKDDTECAARRTERQSSPFESRDNFKIYDTMDLGEPILTLRSGHYYYLEGDSGAVGRRKRGDKIRPVLEAGIRC